MPKAIANIVPVSPYHNLSAGDLADELGKLSADIAVSWTPVARPTARS